MNFSEVNLISDLLRILTPKEISELTTSSSGQKQVSLTDMMTSKLEGKEYKGEEQLAQGSGAKILPFKTEGKEEEHSEKKGPAYSLELGPKARSLFESYSKEFSRMDKNVLKAKRFPRIAESVRKKEMSSFILEEKKKFEKSYEKMKGAEVLHLYKRNASVDIEIQKANKDDFSKTTQNGVLVNKKQA